MNMNILILIVAIGVSYLIYKVEMIVGSEIAKGFDKKKRERFAWFLLLLPVIIIFIIAVTNEIHTLGSSNWNVFSIAFLLSAFNFGGMFLGLGFNQAFNTELIEG